MVCDEKVSEFTSVCVVVMMVVVVMTSVGERGRVVIVMTVK